MAIYFSSPFSPDYQDFQRTIPLILVGYLNAPSHNSESALVPRDLPTSCAEVRIAAFEALGHGLCNSSWLADASPPTFSPSRLKL
uniref:Uncharacterized protein n=1 Tax=mine drainage metagenome TaxID=410659 RepID=E6Q5X3_9ZZZZ